MKKITLLLSIFISCNILAGCTKDQILDSYNNIIQHAGSYELTNNRSLVGSREFGVDDYTGTYIADYKDFSQTENVFGGTSINREHGKELTISTHIEVTSGTAEIFWISGSNEPTVLANTDGDFEESITLSEGGNYIGIKGDNFTGHIELKIK